MRDDVHRYVGFYTICDIPQPRHPRRPPRVCLALALRKVADRDIQVPRILWLLPHARTRDDIFPFLFVLIFFFFLFFFFFF